MSVVYLVEAVWYGECKFLACYTDMHTAVDFASHPEIVKQHGTDVRTEVIAGVTTFLTMVYIVFVNPAILESAGIPRGASTTATVLAAAFGCVLMGLLANRPFAIAPYMGENAFIAFTVVKVMGYPWQVALGAVFIAGAPAS